ncbi:hypothetical protein [Owenweeksia hongkongensis]|uniref:hypothetical protein n=1 Tax=Owenweeksia hongkongensis TaxID=253245 RepID=UPI003A935A7C
MKNQLNASSSKTNDTLLFNIKETVKIVIKFLGITTWIVIFGMALLEIKQYYNIDVIPGVDTSIEEVYSAVFSGVSQYF